MGFSTRIQSLGEKMSALKTRRNAQHETVKTVIGFLNHSSPGKSRVVNERSTFSDDKHYRVCKPNKFARVI
jgi:hypothetical protein